MGHLFMDPPYKLYNTKRVERGKNKKMMLHIFSWSVKIGGRLRNLRCFYNKLLKDIY
jgi:hypothetical protein